MWSPSGSTRRPGSVTTSPLTLTLPAAINLSASRREATPAAASTFCNRSCITRHQEQAHGGQRQGGPQRDRGRPDPAHRNTGDQRDLRDFLAVDEAYEATARLRLAHRRLDGAL